MNIFEKRESSNSLSEIVHVIQGADILRISKVKSTKTNFIIHCSVFIELLTKGKMSILFPKSYLEHLLDTVRLLVNFLQHRQNLWNSFELERNPLYCFDLDKLWATLYYVSMQFDYTRTLERERVLIAFNILMPRQGHKS